LISWIQRSIQLILVVIFPFETLLLWFLPRKIGTFYTALYFSWYPHQGLGIGRYKDTKFWVNFLPRYFTHSMQLHFVHHLHPNIGHWSEPEAIIALKPFLLARGVPGAEQIPDKINYRSLIKKA
ncbi:MAG: stearoyl-CoA 9-desaturase, partial [Gammaproteobacteria bacterium]